MVLSPFGSQSGNGGPGIGVCAVHSVTAQCNVYHTRLIVPTPCSWSNKCRVNYVAKYCDVVQVAPDNSPHADDTIASMTPLFLEQKNDGSIQPSLQISVLQARGCTGLAFVQQRHNEKKKKMKPQYNLSSPIKPSRLEEATHELPPLLNPSTYFSLGLPSQTTLFCTLIIRTSAPQLSSCNASRVMIIILATFTRLEFRD